MSSDVRPPSQGVTSAVDNSFWRDSEGIDLFEDTERACVVALRSGVCLPHCDVALWNTLFAAMRLTTQRRERRLERCANYFCPSLLRQSVSCLQPQCFNKYRIELDLVACPCPQLHEHLDPLKVDLGPGRTRPTARELSSACGELGSVVLMWMLLQSSPLEYAPSLADFFAGLCRAQEKDALSWIIRRWGTHEQWEEIMREAPLYEAVHMRDPQLIRRMVRLWVYLHPTAKWPMNQAIHVAAHCGYAELIPVLVECGADPVHQEEGRRTPYVIACLAGQTAVLDALAAVDPRVMAHSATQFVIHILLEKRSPLTVAVLSRILSLDPSALNRQDGNGLRPLDLAAQQCSVTVISALAEMGAEYRTRPGDPTPLHHAVAHSAPGVGSRAFSSAPMVDSRAFSSAPMVARAFSRAPMVDSRALSRVICALLRYYPQHVNDYDSNGNSALHWASMGIRRTSTMAAWCLLEAGADASAVNAQGRTALHIAGYPNGVNGLSELGLLEFVAVTPTWSRETMQMVLDYYPSWIPARAYCAAVFAARAGRVQSLGVLLPSLSETQKAAVLRMVDPKGKSTLFNLAASGQFETLRILLPFADLELLNRRAKSSGGPTPLLTAVRGGSYHTVAALLEAGADLCISDDAEVSPLHEAAARPRDDPLLELLLKSPNCTLAAVNRPDSRGRTPFFMAARYGRFEAMRMLHRAGACLATPAHDGVSPATIARRNGHSFPSTDFFVDGTTQRDTTTTTTTTPTDAVV